MPKLTSLMPSHWLLKSFPQQSPSFDVCPAPYLPSLNINEVAPMNMSAGLCTKTRATEENDTPFLGTY